MWSISCSNSTDSYILVVSLTTMPEGTPLLSRAFATRQSGPQISYRSYTNRFIHGVSACQDQVASTEPEQRRRTTYRFGADAARDNGAGVNTNAHLHGCARVCSLHLRQLWCSSTSSQVNQRPPQACRHTWYASQMQYIHIPLATCPCPS